ncbi:MAG: hypothetical protein PHC78_03960 [Verrucomicrobiota bacterium]|jgi:hypothetical protein|nr:hypothetical protein [Verrucomicrobiota bacterium]
MTFGRGALPGAQKTTMADAAESVLGPASTMACGRPKWQPLSHPDPESLAQGRGGAVLFSTWPWVGSVERQGPDPC